MWNKLVADIFWFLGFTSGIDARFKSKSAYMKFNCESRIRGYMKEVKTQKAAVIKHLVSLSKPRSGIWRKCCLILCLRVSAFRWMTQPKLYRKLKWKQSFSKRQSACWKCWKTAGTMASTSTGPKRNLIASALGKDGLPARYNTNSVMMASALIITITYLSSVAKICDSVNSKLWLFWVNFVEINCFYASSSLFLFRDHLTRKRASRSTPSTPTAAERPGSSSAPGI